MQMNFKEMNYFITVCDKKSITAAAESLYVSPQALSKTIQKIEFELGVDLLIRSNNGVEVTVYGKLFYDGSKKILHEYDSISTKIKQMSLQNKGILSIVSAYGILRYLTPEFINSFIEHYQETHLDYMEFPDYYIENNVKEQKYDIGLTPYINEDPQLCYKELFSSEIYFIAHKSSQFYDCQEVSIHDVIKEPVILENRNFMIHHIFLTLCKQEQVEPNIYFNTSGFSLCYKLCNEGEGNTISMSFIFEDMKCGELRMIPFKAHPKWKVALVYRKEMPLSDIANKFIKYAEEWCKE